MIPGLLDFHQVKDTSICSSYLSLLLTGNLNTLSHMETPRNSILVLAPRGDYTVIKSASLFAMYDINCFTLRIENHVLLGSESDLKIIGYTSFDNRDNQCSEWALVRKRDSICEFLD